jgi:hypothetical protein
VGLPIVLWSVWLALTVYIFSVDGVDMVAKGAMSFGVAVAVVGVLLKRVPDTSVEGLVKTCPDCAEDVKYEARVCKHCGYRFSDRL